MFDPYCHRSTVSTPQLLDLLRGGRGWVWVGGNSRSSCMDAPQELGQSVKDPARCRPTKRTRSYSIINLFWYLLYVLTDRNSRRALVE
jgi:hypothetical protein